MQKYTHTSISENVFSNTKTRIANHVPDSSMTNKKLLRSFIT